MGTTILQTVEFSCDRCPKKVVVQRSASYDYMVWHVDQSLPAGWGVAPVYDCGMTGYTRHDTVCPKCKAKEARKS